MAVLATIGLASGLMLGLAGPAQASATKTSLAIAVSAAVVGPGGSVKVTATLTKKGKALSKNTVRLQKRTVGSKDWKTMATAKTDGRGKVSFTAKGLQKDHEFRAAFAGSSKARKSTSSIKTVGVRQSIKITSASTASPTAGQTITVKGRTSSGLAGRTVQLQQYSHKKWTKVATAKVSKNASFSLSVKATAAGPLSLRVRADAATGIRSANSETKKFTVFKWYDLVDSTPVSASATGSGIRFEGGPATINGVEYVNSLLGVLSSLDTEDDVYIDMWVLGGKCRQFEATVGFDDDHVYDAPGGIFAAFVDDEMHEIGNIASDEYVNSRIDIRGADRFSLGMTWDGISTGVGIAGFANAKVLCSSRP
ncbi:hypothetical protein LVY72_10435 [Arthrobacter sp. I2-34]|uniref:Uncharacterized protein n=1 Tax=Arthrobacter hankyongi TaxID=2904801 RepID=A0ABS9L781_9MICC|nr:hypothetical protein [Arthrobacter hankyongi]MCG2622334.1 hypothetical protein [Arthrobacter hankyongi]